MATWNSRGLRGSGFEDFINMSNEAYKEKGLGLIQKIPTPIKPVQIDKENRHITLAYFEKDSTVDYIGVVQSHPICFDAKECNTDTFSLQNIHQHQFTFMEEFEKQGGVSFLLIFFKTRNTFYYMRFQELVHYMDRIKEGHPKNFKYHELDEGYFISPAGSVLVHYLEGLSKDLASRT